jgi:hypothetical protein
MKGVCFTGDHPRVGIDDFFTPSQFISFCRRTYTSAKIANKSSLEAWLEYTGAGLVNSKKECAESTRQNKKIESRWKMHNSALDSLESCVERKCLDRAEKIRKNAPQGVSYPPLQSRTAHKATVRCAIEKCDKQTSKVASTHRKLKTAQAIPGRSKSK